jgi:2-oxoglutarate ferredoxin oxidoreductase subunit beta
MDVGNTKTNPIGLPRTEYLGGKSTLCTGCGHDSISNHIISAFYQSGVNPYDVAKMSGIGCSSKTPTYFLSRAHGFNSMHGRMAPVATGAKLANKNLIVLGVSGDGDSASIGLGGFAHLVRRNLPMVYVIANNGVYGLTKGQFSATSELGATLKSGSRNPFQEIDLCTLALDLGCGFVARSFSGDGKQLVPLLSAALKHQGTAIIDIISPCVTFNNHDGSSKSYDAVKEHNVILQELGIVYPQEERIVDYEEGTTTTVEMSDGSLLILRKLHGSHDVTDRTAAMTAIHNSKKTGEILTGLFYINEEQDNILTSLKLSDTPLAQLSEDQLRPPQSALQEVLDTFR